MAKSNAQAQIDYRIRAKTEGDGQRRIDAWLPAENFFQLERLANHYRISKREVLIQLLAQEDQRVAKSINEAEFEEYIKQEITR